MTTTTIQPVQGATCRIGKGKTLWEIVATSNNTLELSALGRGGYVNKSVPADDVNNIQPQQLEVPLCAVLRERERARNAVHNLHDRLRFSNPESITDQLWRADSAVESYAAAVKAHNAGLAELGIEQGQFA